MISVWPRSCDISGNLSLPKGYETGTQDVSEGKVVVYVEGSGV